MIRKFANFQNIQLVWLMRWTRTRRVASNIAKLPTLLKKEIEVIVQRSAWRSSTAPTTATITSTASVSLSDIEIKFTKVG